MGTSLYTGCLDTKVTLRYYKSSCQWFDACQSYKHCLRTWQSIGMLPSLMCLKLFKRMLDQFDRLRKRNAFLEQYKKEKMFENGLEEFDDARLVSRLAARGVV